jgi:hypothetical protein
MLVPGNTEADAQRIFNDAAEAVRFSLSSLSTTGVPVLSATLSTGKATTLPCDATTLDAMNKQPDLFGEVEEEKEDGGSGGEASS